MLGLRSYLLLTCDLLCCLGFLQGLLFEFRRKKQSCNEDHQDAQECCDQIHRCPSDGLLLLFARIVHGPTKIRSSCIKKNSFLRLQRVLFCVSTYSWVPTRHPLPRTRRWRDGIACSLMHCSRPNPYEYCRWETSWQPNWERKFEAAGMRVQQL